MNRIGEDTDWSYAVHVIVISAINAVDMFVVGRRYAHGLAELNMQSRRLDRRSIPRLRVIRLQGRKRVRKLGGPVKKRFLF